jgi:hypothetical protein
MVNEDLSVEYDQEGDVLYLAKSAETASRGYEDELGVVWRMSADDHLIGATVIEFKHVWLHDRRLLTDRLASRLDRPFPEIDRILTKAAES